MDAVRPLRTPTVTLAAALAAGALIGAGGGGATYAALSSGDGSTVVRQVTVSDTQPASSGGNLSAQSIYRLANKGVVEITAGQGQGSGFVYNADGHIITNEHVVAGASSVSVRFWNGKTFTASVVGTDASTDLAVLKVDAPASQLFALSLGDSSTLVVGDRVVAIGSPFGLEGTLTSGIVSALHREMTSPNHFAIDNAIQTDAAINHGNSGGPLLNAQGKVVGVNSQIESDSGGNEGVGFAIPSNTVRSVVSAILQNGSVQHAYLGVSLAADGAARIDAVRPDTPAADAGLQAGDVVTRLDGTAITSGSQLRGVIDARKPDDKVRITVRRNGSDRTFTVTLGVRPD
jgi:putative serine protease PepD